MNDLLRVLNADNIQYYNMQYRPHLVQGQFKSEFQHAEDLGKTCTVDIHYDQALTRRLRSSINKREIWSIQEYNQGNVQLIPSYKKQLTANLLNIGNGALDTQNRIKVYTDLKGLYIKIIG